MTQDWAPRAGFYDDGDELSGAAEYNLPKERVSTILLYSYMTRIILSKTLLLMIVHIAEIHGSRGREASENAGRQPNKL